MNMDKHAPPAARRIWRHRKDFPQRLRPAAESVEPAAMHTRPPLSLPRLSIAGPRPGSAGLRPSRPSAAALAHCAAPRRPGLFARRERRSSDTRPGFDPWARRPLAQVLWKAAARSRSARLLHRGARRLACLQPGTEHMNLLIASLIRILALAIALGLHGLIALTALG